MIDPDRPHRFRPLDITQRPDWGQRRWLRFNDAMTHDKVPCLVCGASRSSPVHWDARHNTGLDKRHDGAHTVVTPGE